VLCVEGREGCIEDVGLAGDLYNMFCTGARGRPLVCSCQSRSVLKTNELVNVMESALVLIGSALVPLLSALVLIGSALVY
jgi:hypothetical protein